VKEILLDEYYDITLRDVKQIMTQRTERHLYGHMDAWHMDTIYILDNLSKK